jgi:hypothetical protein
MLELPPKSFRTQRNDTETQSQCKSNPHRLERACPRFLSPLRPATSKIPLTNVLAKTKTVTRNKTALYLCAVCTLLLAACKVTQIESTARSMNRDLDLVRSPYQYKVNKDETALLRMLRKMPLGETAADPRLRADLEKAIAAKLGAPPKIAEIRIFETHPEFRREIWVAEQDGKKLAFDIHLRPGLRGGVDSTIEGPVEIQGNVE